MQNYLYKGSCGPNAYAEGEKCLCYYSYFEEREGDAKNKEFGCKSKQMVPTSWLWLSLYGFMIFLLSH